MNNEKSPPVRKWRMDELEERSARQAVRRPEWPLIVVCDHIRSALNVGSVFRTADALGAEEIILCGFTARPPHRDILKTALGATETVPWRYIEDPLEALKELQARGVVCIGLEQTTASQPLGGVDWPSAPTALFLGNEVQGLSESLLGHLDLLLEIPQVGRKHSMNVAVAAGIAIWEWKRTAKG